MKKGKVPESSMHKSTIQILKVRNEKDKLQKVLRNWVDAFFFFYNGDIG